MLNEKLRELRLSNNMTQEEVSQNLGISSQTVSKWERGLLSPDISLLPKIAELYDCTIDSLFGMKNIFTMKHHREIGKKLKDFADNPDWENEYHFWLEQIERFPDVYSHYIILMSKVLENRAFEGEVIAQLLILTDYAEVHCKDSDLLDSIHFNMVEILGQAGDKKDFDKLNEYHKKLPRMCNGKERLFKYILSGEALKNRELSTVAFSLGVLTDSILNLITPEMLPEEKLYYYKKAVDIIETVTEGKYAGQYEIPLLGNYYQIALLLKQRNDKEYEKYIEKLFVTIERHLNRYEGMDTSELLFAVKNYETVRIDGLFTEAKRILELMEKEDLFVELKEKTTELKHRYIRYFNM
ncbi:MAG: helix-turn-helix transcriptional regulator [Clostridia bacterium]|nr:helix-turn-helix transcriptional regulator [Clostridia bacterium]